MRNGVVEGRFRLRYPRDLGESTVTFNTRLSPRLRYHTLKRGLNALKRRALNATVDSPNSQTRP